jgi:hypothetical protein
MDRIKTGKEKNKRNDRRHNECAKPLSLNMGIRTVLLNCWEAST